MSNLRIGELPKVIVICDNCAAEETIVPSEWPPELPHALPHGWGWVRGTLWVQTLAGKNPDRVRHEAKLALCPHCVLAAKKLLERVQK